MKLFLPEQIKPYLRAVEDLLSSYTKSFTKPIIYFATDLLLDNLKQYNALKNIRPIHPNDEYYFALFDGRSRHMYFYRSWAAACILYYTRPHSYELRPSESEMASRRALREYLFDILDNGKEDATVCPECFLDGFNIDIEKRTIYIT